ncbi:transposable element tcb2 transposase [Trichonephila clavipes]|nr:transposable element tcb2 transposase [Trichonephila clavipes]
MPIVHSDGLGECQQNNATPHTSGIATYWLQKHFYEFRYFFWPPKFPDRNIIEHFLDALQRAAPKRSPSTLTPTVKWTALQDSWCQLPPELLQTLIEFMPLCVAALLHVPWGFTRY